MSYPYSTPIPVSPKMYNANRNGSVKDAKDSERRPEQIIDRSGKSSEITESSVRPTHTPKDRIVVKDGKVRVVAG